MKISDIRIRSAFLFAGVGQKRLHDALRTMGPAQLKGKELKEGWSESNPTYGFCYVVSEWLYWYLAPPGTKAYSVKVPGDPGTHRFLRYPCQLPTGVIVDLTADQFSNYEDVDYEAAKVTPFMQTGGKGPSKRAQMLAELMGMEKDKWRNPNEKPVQQTNELPI